VREIKYWLASFFFALIAATSYADDIPHVGAGVGANKFDLLRQYLGRASGGDGSATYRKVTQAMARKALDDASDYGIPFIRASATGFAPSTFGEAGDLDLWRANPAAYWSRVDQMMDDLDARSLRLIPVLMWNLAQFPAMTNERISDLIKNDRSASWHMLMAYVADFVTRYRHRPTILFYELSNELNLFADLDLIGRCKARPTARRCEVQGNFSTDEMIAFVGRFARSVRRLDSNRPMSTGFAVPRTAAQHLRKRPEYTDQTGADWRADEEARLTQYLLETHTPVEIISVHIYDTPDNRRFGSSDAADLLSIIKRAAEKAGKTLFVGEFGEDVRQAKDGSFTDRTLKRIVDLRIPYSAIWVLEFYQRNLYEDWSTEAGRFSVQPGQADFLLRRIAEANRQFGRAIPDPQVPDTKPPRIVLTWPLDCTLIKGVQRVHAVASDNHDTSLTVEFLVDGKLLHADGTPPYELQLNAGKLLPGEHRLVAKTIDAAGNAAQWSTRVFVDKPLASTACSAEISKE
jgi:hypothetical protein